MFAGKRQWYRRGAVGICLLAAVGVLGACGGDDDDDASSTTSSSAAAAEPADLTVTCETNIKVSAAVGSMFESESPEDVQAAYTDSGLAALLDTFETNPPDEIADTITEGVGILRTAGETGDMSGLQNFDPTPVDEYMYENCDYPQVDVTAKEYEFDGIPDNVDAGGVSIKFTNGGEENHEFALVRINDGVTETIDELLALPEEQALTKVTNVTGTGAEPGGVAYTATTLEPGNYVALCFVTQGSKGETEGTGPPHAMLGMKKEFTVS